MGLAWCCRRKKHPDIVSWQSKKAAAIKQPEKASRRRHNLQSDMVPDPSITIAQVLKVGPPKGRRRQAKSKYTISDSEVEQDDGTEPIGQDEHAHASSSGSKTNQYPLEPKKKTATRSLVRYPIIPRIILQDSHLRFISRPSLNYLPPSRLQHPLPKQLPPPCQPNPIRLKREPS